LKVNFVSATLSKKVEALGAKLMASYVTAGFNDVEEGADTVPGDANMIGSIPRQVQ